MKKSTYKPVQLNQSKKQVSREVDEDLTDDEDNNSEIDENEIDENEIDFDDDENELSEEDRDFDDEDEDRDLDDEDRYLDDDDETELNEEDRDFDEDGNEYFDALDEPIDEKSLVLSNADKKLAEEKKIFISLKKIKSKELFQNLLKVLDGKNIELKSDRAQYKDEIKDGFLRSIILSMSGFGNDMYEDEKPASFADQLAAAVSGFPLETKKNYRSDEKASLDASQLNELKRLIAKAVDKLVDEKKAGKNSLENKPSYWWQYMPVVYTVRMIAGMCNSIGKYIGVISPSSADLFLEAAKYGQKIKNEFEKDQRERNELNRAEGSKGPLGDLIKHGRKLMDKDERGVLQLQAEVMAHNQKNKYEDRNIFQVTKEKMLVKEGHKYDPRKKKLVDAYVEKDVPIIHVGTKVARKAGGLEKLQAAFRGNLARRNIMNEALPKVINVLRSPEWQVTHQTLAALKELTQDDSKITGYIQELEQILIPEGKKLTITSGEKSTIASSAERLSIGELADAINQKAIDKILIKLNNEINQKRPGSYIEESQESELFSDLSNQIDSYIEKVQNKAKISKEMQEGLAELRIEGTKSEAVQKYLEVVEKALFSDGISFSKASVAGDINADKVTEAMDDLKEIIERDPNMKKLAKRFNSFNEKIADYLEDMKSRSEEISQAMNKEAKQISEDKGALKDYWQEKIAMRKANTKGRE